jgi:hypothetical protein
MKKYQNIFPFQLHALRELNPDEILTKEALTRPNATIISKMYETRKKID